MIFSLDRALKLTFLLRRIFIPLIMWFVIPVCAAGLRDYLSLPVLTNAEISVENLQGCIAEVS